MAHFVMKLKKKKESDYLEIVKRPAKWPSLRFAAKMHFRQIICGRLLSCRQTVVSLWVNQI